MTMIHANNTALPRFGKVSTRPDGLDSPKMITPALSQFEEAGVDPDQLDPPATDCFTHWRKIYLDGEDAAVFKEADQNFRNAVGNGVTEERNACEHVEQVVVDLIKKLKPSAE